MCMENINRHTVKQRIKDMVWNTYMLFTVWEVRTGKIFCRGLKNGPRPKVEGRF